MTGALSRLASADGGFAAVVAGVFMQSGRSGLGIAPGGGDTATDFNFLVRGMGLRARKKQQKEKVRKMKFRMFTAVNSKKKIAVNVDRVTKIVEMLFGCEISIAGAMNGEFDRVQVAESFDVVFSRLNTVAD